MSSVRLPSPRSVPRSLLPAIPFHMAWVQQLRDRCVSVRGKQYKKIERCVWRGYTIIHAIRLAVRLRHHRNVLDQLLRIDHR